jgi:hypothetical protein
VKRAYNGTVCLFCRDLFGSWVGVVYQEVKISVQSRNSTRDVFFFRIHGGYYCLLVDFSRYCLLSYVF